MPVAFLLAILTVQQPPADSYLDPAARELVARARARREISDRSIRGYRVLMKERIGLGIRALRRDRMLYRRELALRIDWRRDSTSRVEVVGGRQSVPAAVPKPELPEDLRGDAADYAFDPADDQLQIGSGGGGSRESPDSGGDDNRRSASFAVRHPIAVGSEADYRYESGDTTTVTFPDGRTLRLYELRVIPRRQDFRLMAGSVWLEGDQFSIVRILFRLARPFDLETDLAALEEEEGDDEDIKHIPRFMKPIRAEVRFITVEYGLWNQRFWLPRSLAFDATATIGTFLSAPLRYERVYSEYEVDVDSLSTPVARAPRPPGWRRERPDSAARAECEKDGAFECRCEGTRCAAFEVVISPDTAALVASADLPPAFSGMNDSLISETELRDLGNELRLIPAAPWQFRARVPTWGVGRYNRVEGLSLGARQGLDLGRLTVDGVVRLGTSDVWPNVEVGVLRETGAARYRLTGYRRLAVADPSTKGLGFGNSLAALFLGRDDGDYFRSFGAEVTGSPAVTLGQTFAWRVYAERQTPARLETQFSLAHLINDQNLFRPNITADTADQFGAALTVRGTRVLREDGAASVGTEVTVDGATGTFGFARSALTVRVNTLLTRSLVGAVEVAGGSSAGRVPVQSLWYLGGANTLRGYGGNAMSGEAFWRARAEVANALPAARVALFFDVGRAAPRDDLSLHRSLMSVGVGASFFDGLLRMDVGRALRAPTGWRVDLYADGVL